MLVLRVSVIAGPMAQRQPVTCAACLPSKADQPCCGLRTPIGNTATSWERLRLLSSGVADTTAAPFLRLSLLHLSILSPSSCCHSRFQASLHVTRCAPLCPETARATAPSSALSRGARLAAFDAFYTSSRMDRLR